VLLFIGGIDEISVGIRGPERKARRRRRAATDAAAAVRGNEE
jgi:hypothetical protein